MSNPEGIQARVEALVDERFSTRFHQIAHYLLGKPPEEVTADELDTFTNELDGLWPYMDQTCYIRGNALHPVYDEGDMQTGEAYGYLDGIFAQSKGVMLRQLPGEEVYKPYHLFLQRAARGWTMITKQDTSLSHVLLEGDGNILPVASMDAIYGDSPERSVTIHENFDAELTDYSRWFMAKLRSKAFRRWPQVEQTAFVDNFLAFCNEHFDVWKASVRVETDYCLKPVVNVTAEDLQTDQHDNLNYRFVPVRGQSIEGIIQAFESPERAVVHERAQRCDDDMYDPRAGLCLAVALKKDYESAELMANEVVLVPLSSQRYSLRFETTNELDRDEPQASSNG